MHARSLPTLYLAAAVVYGGAGVVLYKGFGLLVLVLNHRRSRAVGCLGGCRVSVSSSRKPPDLTFVSLHPSGLLNPVPQEVLFLEPWFSLREFKTTDVNNIGKEIKVNRPPPDLLSPAFDRIFRARRTGAFGEEN